MIEWCAKFADVAQLRKQSPFLASKLLGDVQPVSPSPHAFERKAMSALTSTFASFPRTRVERVYLGSEFCPYLEMSAKEWAEGIDLLNRWGFQATLVLGPQTSRRIEETLLVVADAAQKCSDKLEVVANDWGTLAALSDLNVEPILGRLLFKMKRSPRMGRDTLPVLRNREDLVDHISAQQMLALAQWPFSLSSSEKLLDSLKVRRVEMEMVPQGINPPATPVACSLYTPFTYITGGGVCPVQHLTTVNDETRCARRCRTSIIIPEFENATWPLLQAGHTNFARMTSLLKYYRERTFIDRWVVEPGIPM